jgi:hypothetical protein
MLFQVPQRDIFQGGLLGGRQDHGWGHPGLQGLPPTVRCDKTRSWVRCIRLSASPNTFLASAISSSPILIPKPGKNYGGSNPPGLLPQAFYFSCISLCRMGMLSMISKMSDRLTGPGRCNLTTPSFPTRTTVKVPWLTPNRRLRFMAP